VQAATWRIDDTRLQPANAGIDAMKTVVGSFDSFDEAKRVARDLMDEGFRDSDVSVVASNLQNQYASGTGTSTATTGIAGDNTLGTDAGRRTMADADTRRATGFNDVADTSAMNDMRAVTGAGATTSAGRIGDPAYVSAPADRVTTDGGGLVEGERVRDASGAATGAVTGGVVGGAAGLAASLMGLAIPGIGPIIAAGPIVATLTGAGVGAVAGGLIGGLTDMGVSKPDAEYYAESVRRGGALVTVRADDSRAERAAEVMREHGAIDIERRAERWRERGWTGFDEKAAPYTQADLDRDRDVYGDTDRTTGIASGPGSERGSIADRDTAGSPAERATPRSGGARLY
jgi:hypothetical protein